MRTFDASLSAVRFWIAVWVPPAIFFGLVQVIDNAIIHGQLGIGGLVCLVALAQVLPLAALAWILLSAAAYSIAPGKLIIHRAISDREYALEQLTAPPRLQKRIITLKLPQRVRLRVKEPQTCWEVLQQALSDLRGPSAPLNRVGSARDI